ncbi:MAG: PAS domain S-box protein [Dehalococcoidia bacterium]|nr:PAS domain S-box protein [Dehalococcoidia bacterium]
MRFPKWVTRPVIAPGEQASGGISGWRSPIGVFILFGIAIAVAHTFVEMGISLLPPIAPWWKLLAETAAVLVLLLPPFYLLVIRPFVRYLADRAEAEEALRKGEERYRNLVDTASVGIFETSIDGTMLYANEALATILELDSARQLFQIKVQDFYKDPSRREELLRILRSDGKVSAFEIAVFTSRGNDRHLLLSAVLDNDTLRGMVVDITGRKRLEEALREAEGNFRSSFDDSPAGIRIVSPGGETVYANRVLLDIFGCDSLEEFNRIPIQERYTPESYAEREVRYQMRQRGEYVSPYYEIGIVRKDGEVRRLEAFRKEVLWNGERQFQVLYSDITERKKLEAALRESEQLYQVVVDSANDAISINVGGIRVFANRAFLALHGLMDPHQAVGLPVDNFVVTRDKAQVRERVAARQRGERGAEVYEYSIQRADGAERAVEVSASPVTYKGQPASMAVIRDITERKQLQAQLMQADRLASLGSLVSGIAHEVNNPLTAALGRAELVLRGNLDDALKADIETVRSEIWRVALIMRQLLTFVREHKPEKSYISINEALEATIALRQYELSVSNIEVVKDLQPDLRNGLADRNQIQQVFLNLILNAEQAMLAAHGRGTLLLRTRQVGDTVVVTIADDGPGIAQEHLSRVFDPFFTTKPEGKGTGLGLSVSYGIIQEHGGNIQVASEVGKGAVFTVALPATTDGQSGS